MTLFKKHPRPWLIYQDEDVDPSLSRGGFIVLDSNKSTVIFGGTYSGDGDEEFNLNRTQVAELVAIINAYKDEAK